MFKSRGRSALLLLLWALLVPAHAGPIFINEFHYDNAGADSGEFVELAGIAGTPLLGWSLVFYNGADGTPYYTRSLASLAAAIPEHADTGFGFVSLDKAGIQNGPDGIALIRDGVVEEFLSYEGVFEATFGPAAGMLSTDIGVQETSGTLSGASLQRVGTGSRAEDFDWQVVKAASRDAPNAGQRLVIGGQLAPRTAAPLSAGIGPVWLLLLGWLLTRHGERPVRYRVRQACSRRRPMGWPICTAAPGCTG